MKTELDLSRSALVDHVRHHHRVELTDVLFVPIGEGSWCYRGTGPKELFIRLAKTPSPPGSLLLQQQLHALDFPTIPLLPTRDGGFASNFCGMELTVQPFVNGSSLMSLELVLTARDIGRIRSGIGQETSRLHELQTRISLPAETFSRYQAETRCILEVTTDPVFEQFLEPRRQEIDLLLDTAETMGKRLKALEQDLVVCHGDLHEDNILLSDGGKFLIVDWDNVILAPRERDLMYFMGDGWSDYLRGYRGTRDVEVKQEVLSYYVIEWALQELVDYGSRVLFDDRFEAKGKADAMHQFKRLFEEDQDVHRALKLIVAR